MDKLLDPDTGLMIWTIVTFVTLLVVLGKFAWKPMLKTLNDRENAIRLALEEAQAAKISSAQMREQFEKDVARGQEKMQALLAQAAADAQKVRESLLKEAEAEAQRLSALNKRQLEEEKEKMLRDVRKEVASLSIQAAEKFVRVSMNAKAQDELLQGFFKDLDKQHSKDTLQ